LIEGLMAVAAEPLVVLDDQHRVKQTNSSFCRLLHADGAELKGKLFVDLADGIWNTPEIRSILDNHSAASISTQDITLPLPANGAKRGRLSARKVRSHESDSPLTILSIQTDSFTAMGGQE
jgi:PAS domain-containing protein